MLNLQIVPHPDLDRRLANTLRTPHFLRISARRKHALTC